MNELTCLDVFSGIGGMALAAQRAGFRLVGLCEIEPFCQDILKAHFAGIPLVEDIHGLTGERLVNLFLRREGEFARFSERTGQYHPIADPPTLVVGGFPIQANFSRGTRRENDPRSLWDQFARVAAECRPAWVVAETIPRFRDLGLDDACWDLERAGYATTALVLPAAACDCPSRKDRLYIVGARRDDPGARGADSRGREATHIERWAAPGPGVRRMAVRFPAGVDFHLAALVAYGDATVPGQAYLLLKAIAETELAWHAALEVPAEVSV